MGKWDWLFSNNGPEQFDNEMPVKPLEPAPNVQDENSFLNKITGLDKMGMGFKDLQPMSNNSPMDVNPDLPKVNPKVVDALRPKMRQPASESSKPLPSAPIVPEAPAETVDKVSPWAMLASGLGQTLQGQPVDLSWARNLNKERVQALQDKLNKKYELEKQKNDSSFRDRQQSETERHNKALEGLTRDTKTKESVDKNKKLLNEVEDRRSNIKDNIRLLKSQIKEYGTFEAFGPENQNMDRMIDQIATDMAKLQDPESVARPGEVELVKKSLIQSGFKNSNATALSILDKFEKEVDKRAGTAYKVRGVEPRVPISTELKVGDIEDGHTFLGGDPADPKNWRQ